jgi:DNA replication protein DnaC
MGRIGYCYWCPSNFPTQGDKCAIAKWSYRNRWIILPTNRVGEGGMETMTHYATEGDGKPAAPAPEKSCPRCLGTGWFNQEERVLGYQYTATVSHRCDCDSALKIHRSQWAVRSGVPNKWRVGWDSFLPSSPAHDQIRALAEGYANGFTKGQRNGLLLRGTVGAGKSHLAALITHHVSQRGFTARWFNAPGLVDALTAAFDDPNADGQKRVLAECAEVDLLTIDDMGAQRMSDFVSEAFFKIINTRCEQQKALLFTTNLDYNAFEAHFGSRIGSRLFRVIPRENMITMPPGDYARMNGVPA